jgi:hypothetical protein
MFALPFLTAVSNAFARRLCIQSSQDRLCESSWVQAAQTHIFDLPAQLVNLSK